MTMKIIFLKMFSTLIILSVIFSETRSQSSKDDCQSKDSKCSFGNRDFDYSNDLKVPIGIISTDQPKVFIPGKDIISNNEKLTFICTGKGNKFDGNKNSSLKSFESKNNIDATCKCNKLFNSMNTIFDVDKLKCKNPNSGEVMKKDMVKVYSSVEYKDLRVHEAGVKIKDKFFSELRILISEVYLFPTSVQFKQKSLGYESNKDMKIDRSKMLEGADYSAYTHVRHDYEINKQKGAFELRGLEHLITSGNYFVPAYLAPGHALSSVFGHLSSNFYINTAPQWKSINDGNWKITQNFLHEISYYDTAMAGIHGGLYISGKEFNDYPLRLTRSVAVSSLQMFIPQLFVLLVHNGKDCGTAFITLNNPYADDNLVNDLMHKTCKYSHKASSPNWSYEKTNGHYEKGFSFYCLSWEFVYYTGFPYEDSRFYDKSWYNFSELKEL